MSAKYRYGDGDDYIAIAPAVQTVSGTTPIVSKLIDMRNLDSISLQLITEDQVDEVTTGTAALVASTKTYTISAYDFTGKLGATIRISGAAHAGNNGDHVITTVSSAHVVICSGDSGDVNETFDLSTATIEVIRTDDEVTGDWTIELSNNYVAIGAASYGQIAESGDWTDITSAFSPSIAAVTEPSNQYVQADIAARVIRATFTPTDGVGTVRANVFAKSWS